MKKKHIILFVLVCLIPLSIVAGFFNQAQESEENATRDKLRVMMSHIFQAPIKGMDKDLSDAFNGFFYHRLKLDLVRDNADGMRLAIDESNEYVQQLDKKMVLKMNEYGWWKALVQKYESLKNDDLLSSYQRVIHTSVDKISWLPAEVLTPLTERELGIIGKDDFCTERELAALKDRTLGARTLFLGKGQVQYSGFSPDFPLKQPRHEDHYPYDYIVDYADRALNASVLDIAPMDTRRPSKKEDMRYLSILAYDRETQKVFVLYAEKHGPYKVEWNM